MASDLTWTRKLNRHAEAVLGAVWQMPEVISGYPAISLSPVAASIASRAACLGAVRGPVAGALLSPLNPRIVERVVDKAWRTSTPAQLLEARWDAVGNYLDQVAGDLVPSLQHTIALLTELVDGAPADGHPMFAAVRSLDPPVDSLTRVWWLCDALRERRGDSHRNAWVAAGFTGCEIVVLTELRDGLELGAVSRHQLGWAEGDIAGATAALEHRGLVTGNECTALGLSTRDEVERATDAQETVLGRVLAEQAIEGLRPLSRRVTDRSRIAWSERPG
jgi:hypothetical protein